MTKAEFKRRFAGALEEAATLADEQLGRPVPRHFVIRLYGAGHRGDVVSVTTAAGALYLAEDRFYRIIDVGVVEVCPDTTTIFVRASAHEPSRWDQTWNSPPGSGPFKQLGPRIPIQVSAE